MKEIKAERQITINEVTSFIADDGTEFKVSSYTNEETARNQCKLYEIACQARREELRRLFHKIMCVHIPTLEDRTVVYAEDEGYWVGQVHNDDEWAALCLSMAERYEATDNLDPVANRPTHYPHQFVLWHNVSADYCCPLPQWCSPERLFEKYQAVAQTLGKCIEQMNAQNERSH